MLNEICLAVAQKAALKARLAADVDSDTWTRCDDDELEMSRQRIKAVASDRAFAREPQSLPPKPW